MSELLDGKYAEIGRTVIDFAELCTNGCYVLEKNLLLAISDKDIRRAVLNMRLSCTELESSSALRSRDSLDIGEDAEQSQSPDDVENESDLFESPTVRRASPEPVPRRASAVSCESLVDHSRRYSGNSIASSEEMGSSSGCSGSVQSPRNNVSTRSSSLDRRLSANTIEKELLQELAAAKVRLAQESYENELLQQSNLRLQRKLAAMNVAGM